MNKKQSEELARAAKDMASCSGVSSGEAFEKLCAGIRKIPHTLQVMVDTLVDMQETFPMPKEGWDAFVRDIEYTNKKHGYNLQIRKGNK